MNPIAASISGVFDVGLMACLSIAYGNLSRLVISRRRRTAALGSLFGFVTVLSAIQSSIGNETYLIEGSSLFVGFAAAFLGSIGAISALVTAGVLGLLVGDSNATDLMQLVLALIAGWLWGRMVHKWDRRQLRALLLLGAMMSVALMIGHMLPGPPANTFSTEAILISLGVNLVIATLLGGLLERERSMFESEQQLRVLADTDPLTGLHNRRTITAAFANLGTNNLGKALMLIDIDHFKSINDAHGHTAGDKVLRQISEQLRSSVRAGALVSRYGGEEFAILLDASSLEEAVTVAERLRTSMERNRVNIGQLALPVTASIGVAWWLGASTFEDKFKIADHALYRAKVEGRNRVVANYEINPDYDVLVGAPK